MARFNPPNEAEFRRVFDRLKHAYNVAHDSDVVLCAHHYQGEETCPFIQLGYFELNYRFGFRPIPFFVEREDIYFPAEVLAA